MGASRRSGDRVGGASQIGKDPEAARVFVERFDAAFAAREQETDAAARAVID
jgi:hypothetical protein